MAMQKDWPCTPIPAMLHMAILAGLLGAGLADCRPRTGIPAKLSARLVAQDFASPVELVTPPDGSGRLFVVDQVGLIWILSGGKRLDHPFLDIRDRLVELLPFHDERGLLGLAFHPHFAANGIFYVYYSAPLRAGLSSDALDHTTRISAFSVSAEDPDRADSGSERVVLSIDKPGYNYEGGGLVFGPDGFLYIGTGDSIHNPSSQAGQFAQDTSSLLGKILRIDVNGSGADVNSAGYHIPQENPFYFYHERGRPEIYALGFRNPYRIWFDEGSPARLFAGDVGQAMLEQIDVVTAGSNYGWPIREGNTCFNAAQWSQPLTSCAAQGMIDPVLTYPHGGKASAVIGGVVYHGSALPALDGDLLFGDWGRGPGTLFVGVPPTAGFNSWSAQPIAVDLPAPKGAQLLGIAVDARSQLYLLSKDPGIGPVGRTGKIYQVALP